MTPHFTTIIIKHVMWISEQSAWLALVHYGRN